MFNPPPINQGYAPPPAMQEASRINQAHHQLFQESRLLQNLQAQGNYRAYDTVANHFRVRDMIRQQSGD